MTEAYIKVVFYTTKDLGSKLYR